MSWRQQTMYWQGHRIRYFNVDHLSSRQRARKNGERAKRETLFQCLRALKIGLLETEVRKLEIFTLECGARRLQWSPVKKFVEAVFRGTQVEILAYSKTISPDRRRKSDSRRQHGRVTDMEAAENTDNKGKKAQDSARTLVKERRVNRVPAEGQKVKEARAIMRQNKQRKANCRSFEQGNRRENGG